MMSLPSSPAGQGSRFIMHLDQERYSDLEAFPATPWGTPWDEVHYGDRRELLDRFDVTLDTATAMCGVFGCTVALRLAIWCREVDKLLELRDMNPGVTVIFAPNPLGILEFHRRQRRTLRLAQPVRRGEPLEARHLEEVERGDGVDAALRSLFLGRPSAYDLNPGEAMDFGKIL